jgi:hypothetical protein
MQQICCAAGSKMSIVVTPNYDNNRNVCSISMSITGQGILQKDDNLQYRLYPELMEYLSLFLQDVRKISIIKVCSEFYDRDGTLYRAHHNYRSNGPWHDWAWIAYVDPTSKQGFTNVPAKLLCFLPDGLPNQQTALVVCHPCQWEQKKLSQTVKNWNLVVPSYTKNRRTYGFDIVETSAITGLCFAVPDLSSNQGLPSSAVYTFEKKEDWGKHFLSF